MQAPCLQGRLYEYEDLCCHPYQTLNPKPSYSGVLGSGASCNVGGLGSLSRGPGLLNIWEFPKLRGYLISGSL